MQLFWILLVVRYAAGGQIRNKFARKRCESENRFRQLFEAGIGGVALESFEGKLAIVNPAFCAIFGYTEAELHT